MSLGLIIVLIVSAILFVFLAFFYLIPFFFGAPYDISRKSSLSKIIKLTSPRPGDKIAELGSGDGRVCIALAKSVKPLNSKIEIYGFEINPFLVFLSRRKIRKLGLEDKIKIYWKNFFKADLRKYNKVVFFQFRTITKKLGKKLKKELKPKSLVVSHQWKLPDLKIKKKFGKPHLTYGAVYLYEV